MNVPTEVTSVADGMEVRIALGEYTFRNRLKLIWWVIIDRVVTLSGSPILNMRTLNTRWLNQVTK